ncbi:MAG: phosphatase PAP2 family protein [bacterium]|nr:phosphatase PAP2 family protein [bacterium]
MKCLHILLILGVIIPSSYASTVCLDKEKKELGTHQRQRKRRNGRATRNFFSSVAQDVIDLNKNIFTWDSLKVAAIVLPFYVGSRMIDEELQSCFYDPRHHKNVNPMPDWCHAAAKWGITAPIIFFGAQAFLSTNEDMRQTSRIFLLGLPFVIWAKNILKEVHFDANLRPWHEKYSCVKRAYGGFPSGHMAEATYATVLFGLRFGPRVAVPLGVLAAFVGGTFVTCNRHYLSQVVAGAGLGIIYALAANKVVDSKFSESVEIGLTSNKYGGTSLSLTYHF